MSFGQVALLFLVQMAFGGLVAEAIVDRRALGPKFAKVSGWILVALLGLALSLCGDALFDPDAASPARALAGSLAAAALGVLGYASLAGWDRRGAESACLVLAIGAMGAAVALSAAREGGGGSPTPLVHAAAFGSALTLGVTTWAMLLGHWYLVAPGLPVSHLARLVRPLPWLLGAKLVVSATVLALGWELVLGGESDLSTLLSRRPERVIDVVNLLARIPVGLAVPLVLACMARVTVRMEKTQPATGILYAACALVYLGDLMGKMVQGAGGPAL